MSRRHLIGLAVLVTAVAITAAPPRQTLASWSDAEHATAALTAGTVEAPTALHCTAGLLSDVTFTWTAPVGGAPRTGYTWVLTGLAFGSGTLAANATSVTLPAGILNVIATSTFTLYANGTGTWTSSSLTGYVTITGALGIPVATSCLPL